MTPQSSQLLVDEILPLLTRNVPATVYPCPGEDTCELIQDGVAIAADMMELMEKSGKPPIASSIAYYSIMMIRPRKSADVWTGTSLLPAKAPEMSSCFATLPAVPS